MIEGMVHPEGADIRGRDLLEAGEVRVLGPLRDGRHDLIGCPQPEDQLELVEAQGREAGHELKREECVGFKGL